MKFYVFTKEFINYTLRLFKMGITLNKLANDIKENIETIIKKIILVVTI